MHQMYQTIIWIITLWSPPSNRPQFLKGWRNQETCFTQSGRPLKGSSLNVTISPTAAGSTTSKHMLEPDREAVVACTNGHVSRVTHVSIPKTRIRRMPEVLPARREEGDIRQFCAETLTSGTHARARTRCTRAHLNHHYWIILLHFSMIPPLHRN